jgi:hypothetical protein
MMLFVGILESVDQKYSAGLPTGYGGPFKRKQNPENKNL